MGKVTVRVQPGASRSGVVADAAGGWRLAVTAPPIEGRANEACVALLAELLGRPKRDVELIRGSKARSKTFEVAGMEAGEIEARLREHAK